MGVTTARGYRELSFWHESAGDDLAPRPALDADLDVDVAVVGAGFTGLWTAYYLRRLDPSIRVAVLEREVAGFGASGRNGGWCSALFPAEPAAIAKRYGGPAALAMRRAMIDTVDEVGRIADAEGIDCHYAKGGTVVLARTPVQMSRATAEVAEAREFGAAPDDLVLLSAEEARSRVGATGVLGGTYTPHCAVIHPGRLVRGLARAVVGLGVALYEQTPVTAVRAGLAETPGGRVRATFVIRATEGYTPGLPGYRRAVAPVYSLMIATEPLPDEFWSVTGLAGRETFSDYRHLIIYGQRTADNRFAFGGRGAPYHFGSAVKPEFDCDPAVFAALERALRELFPAIADAAVTHRWGGPLGIPRDWFASVGLDRGTGIGWAGGYVGDGVGTTNLAGRTLADLVLGRDSELVRLPWVGHRSRRWEPEPLRWLGINAGLRMMTAADHEEMRTGRPSRRAALVNRLRGH
ncbi:MAG TPA: FAD-dependent oxidoreductase [Actinomycetes bacterium]|nr:FAD-dependent oxidoreductase [Actinomycetes bacterium]